MKWSWRENAFRKEMQPQEMCGWYLPVIHRNMVSSNLYGNNHQCETSLVLTVKLSSYHRGDRLQIYLPTSRRMLGTIGPWAQLGLAQEWFHFSTMLNLTITINWLICFWNDGLYLRGKETLLHAACCQFVSLNLCLPVQCRAECDRQKRHSGDEVHLPLQWKMGWTLAGRQ